MESNLARPLKIAQIAPLWESVPPHLYGGTERVVAHLANELVALGHPVTLFASAEAATSAELVAVRSRALRLDPDPLKSELAAHLAMLHRVRERAGEFDVLHFHVDLLHFPFFESLAQRTLTTLHGRLDLADLPEAYGRWPQYPLVSISASQRLPHPSANWLGTVHHGLPSDLFTFSPAHRGTLAFVGRIAPEKRPDRAIRIARRAGMRLQLAAKVDAQDAQYFHDVVEPLLGDPVDFVGEVGEAQKDRLLGEAAALLFPIDWPEPFGLVVIEAMACGTPVVAWGNGAVPEIVEHGVTGFIVESEDEAVAAVERIDTIDRRRVRATFERRFSAAAMARHYVQLYTELHRRARRHRTHVRDGRKDRAANGHRAVRA